MKTKVRVLQAVSVIGLILVSMLFTSCEKYVYSVEAGGNPNETVLFQTQIQPIFSAICITCHKGTRNPDLRDGRSYASLTTGGYVNLPAETSRLYEQINSSSHASFTTPAQKQLILFWIQQGAQNN